MITMDFNKFLKRLSCVAIAAALGLSGAAGTAYADEYIPIESQAASEIKAPELYVKAFGDDYVTLGFSDVENALYYQITMSEDAENYNPAGSLVFPGENEYRIDGLISGRTYYFKIYAIDTFGQSSSESVSLAVEAGNTKCVLGDLSIDDTGVALNWKPTVNAAFYRVYRSLTKKGGYKNIKTVYGVSYSDKKISIGNKYFYKVMPVYVNEEGKKVKGKCSGVKSITVDIEAPEINEISYDNSKFIKLNWDKKAFVSGYKVYRSEKKNKGYKLIKTVNDADNTEYYDYSVDAGTKYFYKLTSYFEETESGYSHAKSQWTASAHPTDLTVTGSADGVKLTWSKTKNASAYNIFRSTDASEGFEIIGYKVKGTSFTDTEYHDSNLNYYYRISAVHGQIEGVMSNAVGYSEGELTINTRTIFVSVGESAVLTAFSADAGSVSFESNDEDIASVSGDGVITGVAAGKTKINISANGKAAECTVTVTDFKELGIDVSKHQGDINWTKVKASGIDYVMLRIGYGLDIERKYETKFEEYYDGAESAGIPVGVYLFSTAMSAEEATAEAEFIVQRLEGRPLSLPVALDLESDKQRDNLSVSEKTDIITSYKNVLESAGYDFILYSNLTFIRDKIDQSLLSNEDIDLWIARYRDVSLGSGYVGNGNVRMWQYSDKGLIDGILDDKGNYNYVDLDVTVGDELFV
ncbi:MAG: Ig-like domain-containing protein [Lachnospiraceae bacterium]|nr:Ig-like domain-containing protein [Lachnospiraceae bacterium]